MKERFYISNILQDTLSPEDLKVTKLGDFYLTKIIQFANEAGLKGKKIETIYGIQEEFSTGQMYVDFTVRPLEKAR